MAIAGGVNLLLSPDTFMQLQNLSVLSPEGRSRSFDDEGRSRSFDDEGRGYGRGEGCGIVVLKPLASAQRDGDPIRAVIRGTGSNSDGWTKGMAMPSGASQMQLIEDVYERFGLDYSDTQYVEAHYHRASFQKSEAHNGQRQAKYRPPRTSRGYQAWISSTLRDGHIRSERPYAPTFIAEMEVSADFPEPKGQILPGVCHSRRSGFKEWSVDTSLFDESLSSPCLSFTDFRLSELDATSGAAAAAAAIARLATVDLPSKDKEFRVFDGRLQVAWIVEDRQGDSLVAEHLADSKRVASLNELDFPVKLAIGQPGLLDTFHFVKDDDMMEPLGDLDVQVQVHAASLNFKDVMAAMGMIAIPALGSEASGIVVRTGRNVKKVQAGDRVVILCPEGTHKTLVRVGSNLITKLPDSLTYEEAVSIPVAYITAYQALVNVARLSKGQSVLIHAAAGAVGQAAIQIALLRGLVVYATAGSPEKRAFLTERYRMPSSNIFHSRDASFAKAFARVTDKRGVDCVLNSLSGELLRASWDCVAPFGSFVELGLRDLVNNTRLDMKPFRKNISFSFFDVKDLPESTQADLRGDVSDEGSFLAAMQQYERNDNPAPIRGVVHLAAVLRDAVLENMTHDDWTAALYEYGVDSLVAIEVRNWINLAMNANIALLEIMGGESTSQFAVKVAEPSTLVSV
ncbi:hypothetical protein MCOR25_003932 [Pyricularia grisea]|nr:hypothetical protein MCOR25_003932 [Pyricularia grisea]